MAEEIVDEGRASVPLGRERHDGVASLFKAVGARTRRRGPEKGSVDPVRAIATLRLSKLITRLKLVGKGEAENAHRQLLAADIKRFLERGLDPNKPIPLPTADAPPGAPIGDDPLDWLAPAPYYPRGWQPQQ